MAKDQEQSPDELDWVELKPDRDPKLLPNHGFRMFLVQVKSETDSGRHLHNHPLEFFRQRVPEMGELMSEDDVRAVVLRANAERSANPRHRSELWVVIPGSTTAVGIQYKHAE